MRPARSITVLGALYGEGINLLRLAARPVPEISWAYRFFLDCAAVSKMRPYSGRFGKWSASARTFAFWVASRRNYGVKNALLQSMWVHFEIELGIYELGAGGGIRLVDNLRHVIALGSDSYRDGEISFPLVQELIAVLKDFTRVIAEYRCTDLPCDWRPPRFERSTN